MIILEIAGVEFNNFVSFKIGRSLDTIAGIFSIAATVDDMSLWPIKVGSSARILVNDNPFITGFIDEISVQHDINSHTITLSGNSKTIDVVETSMGEQSAFTGDTTFQKLIENALINSNINLFAQD